MSALDGAEGLFVKPVEGQDDLFAFQFGFDVQPEGKAETVTETESGDLIIEGLAADFTGIDRQGENFMDGAFQRGIAEFMENSGSLCYHHDHAKCIGKVLELREVEGKGLWMKARVDAQPEQSPLHYIYNGIRKGSYKNLSVGGFFRRKLTENGPRINHCDFTEISVTPVSVHSKTKFAVVAGKALTDVKLPAVPKVDGEIRDDDVFVITEAIAMLERTFDRLKSRGKPKKDRPKSSAEQAVDALSG